ncbi:MAG: polysaccharide deacetylase family protein [Planctomycetota bacterium]|jgi:peptidoglycan/xylan/chitin deacetylase (PgdA/CDA1 family)
MIPRAPWLRFSLILHVAAVAVAVLRPAWWPWIVAVVLANHLITAGFSLWPRSRMVGPNLTHLPGSVDGAVALTFDDGPDPEVTPQVLALLRRRGVQATFFCIGRKAEANPGLLRAMAEDGHLVENHSYGHSNLFCMQPPWVLGRDIDRAQQALRLGGGSPRYFRAPAGLRNPWLDGVLQKRGLDLVSWSRRGYDTNTGDPDRILERLCRDLRGGEVLLLHDGSSARDSTGRPVVLSVLPRLLERLDAAGLRPVPFPRA